MLEKTLRHWTVFLNAWRAESGKRKSGEAKRSEDPAFLPAALEILERPASPVGRAIAWSIVAFVCIATIWSILGHVDVVVTAQGKLIPLERVKVIQPADYGVVRNIHVVDGQRVHAGDSLIELDPTVAGADQEAARRAWEKASIDLARSKALLSYLNEGTSGFTPPEGVLPITVGVQQQLIDSQIREYEAQLAALQQERHERIADVNVVIQQIEKLNQTLPLVAEQLEARRELMERGYSPRLTFLELKEKYVGLLQDIEIQKENKIKAQAAIASLDRQIDKLTEEFRKNVVTDLAKAQVDRAMAEQELAKATRINVQQKLLSPIDGTVQQLAVHTIGGVVEPAQQLLVVVPDNSELVVDAMVANRDIGFIIPDAPVEVKLEAFPFTKYGVIEGVLIDISNDAIQDEDLGLVYQARVDLSRDTIMVDGHNVKLTPGMAVTAEIKTGKRRLIEFLLAPLLKYKNEALRER